MMRRDVLLYFFFFAFLQPCLTDVDELSSSDFSFDDENSLQKMTRLNALLHS